MPFLHGCIHYIAEAKQEKDHLAQVENSEETWYSNSDQRPIQ